MRTRGWLVGAAMPGVMVWLGLVGRATAQGFLPPIPPPEVFPQERVSPAQPVPPLPDLPEAPTQLPEFPRLAPEVLPAVMAAQVEGRQAPRRPKPGDGEDFIPFAIQLTPPGQQQLFRLESEEALRERLRKEYRKSLNNQPVEFPPSVKTAAQPTLPPRLWGELHLLVEPNYVCHRRLWFEQRNFERYGWDLGILQPVVSTGLFYTDLAMLPVNWLAYPFRCYDCSTGLCLPGDPVPLLWYPCAAK